jgi:uncharacterized protein (DUF305 family)
VRRLLVTLLIVALAVLAAGCGDDHDEGEHMEPGTAPAASSQVASATSDVTAAGSSSAPDEADVTFAQNMIPHHEQAVEMAEAALDPVVGAGPEVTDLATRIRDAQDPEIQQMRGWLETWGEPEMDAMSDDEHSTHGMEGMMSADEMAELEGRKGAEFDRMWMEMMIRHHEGAIAMAETAKSEGSAEEVKALADAVIRAQQKEIEEMQTLLDAS